MALNACAISQQGRESRTADDDISFEYSAIHDLRRTGAALLTEHGFNRDVSEKALSDEAQGIRTVHIVAEFAEQRRKCFNGGLRGQLVTETKVILGYFGSPAA